MNTIFFKFLAGLPFAKSIVGVFRADWRKSNRISIEGNCCVSCATWRYVQYSWPVRSTCVPVFPYCRSLVIESFRLRPAPPVSLFVPRFRYLMNIFFSWTLYYPWWRCESQSSGDFGSMWKIVVSACLRTCKDWVKQTKTKDIQSLNRVHPADFRNTVRNYCYVILMFVLIVLTERM